MSYINASSSDSGEQRGKMLYAYQATGDGEISVSDGQEFTVVDPDGNSHPAPS
jgi:hypothetical protein